MKNFFRRGAKYSIEDIEKFSKIFMEKEDRRRKAKDPLAQYEQIDNLISRKLEEQEDFSEDTPVTSDPMNDAFMSALLGFVNKSNSKTSPPNEVLSQSSPELNSEKVSLISSQLKAKVPKKYLSHLDGLSDREILAIVGEMKK